MKFLTLIFVFISSLVIAQNIDANAISISTRYGTEWTEPEDVNIDISIRESLMIIYTTPIQVLNYLQEVKPFIKTVNDDITYECCDRNNKNAKCIVQMSPIENNLLYLYIIKNKKQIRYTIKNEIN